MFGLRVMCTQHYFCPSPILRKPIAGIHGPIRGLCFCVGLKTNPWLPWVPVIVVMSSKKLYFLERKGPGTLETRV